MCMILSEEKPVARRGFLKLLSLAALSSVALAALPANVRADVPDVQMIENISQDSSGKIRLQIRHANPNSAHYIDQVEVDVDGNIQQLNLQPQTTDPFIVELDLGTIQGNPNVRARTHCIIHGYGAWSNQIQIPELHIPALAILGALIASLALVKRK